MKLDITCYKAGSGKWYANTEVTVPDMVIETPETRLMDSYATRDYLIAHPELWPVTHLDSFHTTITLIEDDTTLIVGVPIMIPAGFQANRKPYVPLSA